MNWAVIIAALITLVGGALVFRWQKHQEHQANLREERRKIYRQFCNDVEDVVYSLTFKQREESLESILALRKRYLELFTTAPDHVVKPCGHLVDFIVQAVASDDFEELKREAIAEIYGRSLEVLREMRSDSFFTSTIDPSLDMPLVRNRAPLETENSDVQ